MKFIILLSLLILFLSSCGQLPGDKNTFYGHPTDFDLNYETFYLHTTQSYPFHSWWLSPKENEAKATILFFHENTYNKSYHLPQSKKLVEDGYNILTFDYLSKGYSNFGLKTGATDEGLAALNYLIGEKEIIEDQLIIYAQGNAAYIAFDTLEEFGVKPVCIILDDPPSSLLPSYFMKTLSSLNSMVGSLLGGSDNDFKNDQKDTPVLIYCTEKNESPFEQLANKSDLTVRAVLSGNGSQKILNSKSIRLEMSEFISMSMNPIISIQTESPQE